jgi:hypothetical protein
MKKKFTFSKGIRNSLIVFFLGIILITGGCYTIEYIVQPAVVRPNSAFNVKIAIKPDVENTEDYESGTGILGIILPEGWIVKDSIGYSVSGGGYDQVGVFRSNAGVVSFLNSYATQPPSGYRWWGAKSLEAIDLRNFKTGVVNLTIITNEKLGEFKTKYLFGDDSDWNKKEIEDPYGIVHESGFIPIKVDIIDHTVNSWINEEWEIYPNPSDGQIYIRQASSADGIVMKVYDLNGRLQKSEVLHESLNYIDLSILSKGTYIISLEKHGEIKTKRLIIQ